MLAGILKSKVAVQISISIMRAFVEMRKFISLNGQIFERLTSVEYKHEWKKYDISKEEELKEQTKLVNSFLKLAYWY